MAELQTVKDRISYWIEYLGISVAAFERKCGLGTGYVASLRDNTNSKKINDILNAYPQLSRKWLQKGEGEMLNSAQNIQINSGGQNQQNNGSGNPQQNNGLVQNQSGNDNTQELYECNNNTNLVIQLQAKIESLKLKIEGLNNLISEKNDKESAQNERIFELKERILELKEQISESRLN